MSEMASNRSTIWTLSVMAALLLCVAGAAVWLVDGSVERAAEAEKQKTTQRLVALQAGLQAAAQYVNTEHDAEASTILEKLAQEFPDEPLVWQQLSEVRLHQGRVAEAYAMMTKVIDLGHDSRDLEFNAGLVAAGLDKVDEAIIHLQQACRMAPSDIQAPLYLANLYRKTNEIPKAQQQLLHVIDIDENVAEAWGGLAQIAYIEDKLDFAEQHLAKARQLAPGFPTWQILEAKILRRRGKPEAAITLLSALNPDVRYTQEVVSEVASCWGFMRLPRKAAQEHVDFLNRKPDALPSAIAATRFFLQAGEREEAQSWLAYAQRLDAQSPQVIALAQEFEPRDPQP